MHHLAEMGPELEVCGLDGELAFDTAAHAKILAKRDESPIQRLERRWRRDREITDDLLQVLDRRLREIAELEHPRRAVDMAELAESRQVRGFEL